MSWLERSSAVCRAMSGLCLFIALPVWAQDPGNLGLVVRDDTLGLGKNEVVGPGEGSEYLIGPELGKTVDGKTLLHSFRDFSIGFDETATFTGPDNIDTIVTRVTGTKESAIDGTLRSDIAGADLYLMNPNGVVFGERSSLDVKGSLHVTTADFLGWQGQEFRADMLGEVPSLAFSGPASFGFLSDSPAGIEFDNPMRLSVDPGRSMHLIGGDVRLEGRPVDGVAELGRGELLAEGGAIQIVSVASEGVLTGDALDSGSIHQAFDQLGTIEIAGGLLNTSGPGSGSVVIRGGQLHITAAAVGPSGILAQTTGRVNGALVDIVANDVSIGGSLASVNTKSTGRGQPGPIVFDVETLRLEDGGRIESLGGSALGTSAGEITISASESVDIVGHTPRGIRSGILSVSFGEGDAGSITIDGRPSLHVLDSGFISAASRGNGGAGVVTLDVRELVMDGGARIEVGSSPANPLQGSNSGSISILDADRVTLTGVGDVPLCGGEFCSTAILARATGEVEGIAGNIDINSDLLLLDDTAFISGNSAAGADAAPIDLRVGDLIVKDGARIESDSVGTGIGGSILVSAERTIAVLDGDITTNANGGTPGSITLAAPVIALDGLGGRTTVSAENQGTGDGGDVMVLSDLLLSASNSTVSTKVQDGTGGDVTLTSGVAMVLVNESEISASSQGASGGNIFVTSEILIRSPDTTFDATGATEKEGGEVVIKSPVQVITDQATPLPAEFLDVSSMMLASCQARRSGERAGSFQVARWRGLPLSPEGPLIAFEQIGGALPAVAAAPAAAGAASDQVALADGAVAFRGGRLESARESWQAASEAASRAGHASTRSEALRGVANAIQAQGDYAESIAPLEEALVLARGAGDPAGEAAALGNLGNAYVALREPEQAQDHLTQAVSIARGAGDTRLVAGLLNNLGNHYSISGAYAEAEAAYRDSAAGAREAGDPLRAAQAQANAASVALRRSRAEEAATLLIGARRSAEGLDGTRDGVALQIHLAQSYAELARLSPEHHDEGLLLAHGSLIQASEQSRALQDLRSLSYAQGNLGALYALEERTEEALYLTRQALRAADAAEAPDLLSRWHGQVGQILWAAGQGEAALDAYRRAVDLVEETRPEMRARYGASDVEFQRQVEPVYLALVDALLQRASSLEGMEAQMRLAEARETVERWKAAELRDYFRDECVAELEAKATPAESLSQTAAIVYPIQLTDRLELLVSSPSGIRQYTVGVSAEDVTRSARSFRQLLQRRATLRYLRPAQQLFAWLVEPYAEDLASQGIKTLVFVPGGVLRTIPMAALHDGQRHLVERFAVAVTPSLNLLEPKPLEPGETRMLLAGVSEAVQGFEALDTVPQELAAVQALYGGEVLLDENFQLARLEEELRERRPGVVHLASHANFTGDPRASFILTHDEKLSMDRLSELVGAGRFNEEPLELLVLSACSTAAGDERAALGLSGVAIRAGARSALGSLWNVSDRASAELIVGFYRELGGVGVSKAEALQRAQRQLLARVGFEHPFYWAPFLVINNWL